MSYTTIDHQIELFTADSISANAFTETLPVVASSMETMSTPEIIAIEPVKASYFVTGLEVCDDMSEPELDLVESLVVKGALSTIVGSSSVGKSMLARQLALSIVNMEDHFLGFKINTDCNDVVYCSTEDTKMFWTSRLKNYNPDGSKDSSLTKLHLLFGSDAEHFVALVSILKKTPIALIIIDVFSDIYTGDPNNNIQVRKFLKNYKNLAHQYGTSFLLVHHIGKRTEKLAPTKDSIMGSQGYESSMRSAFELRADQYDTSKRHLCIVKQNYIADDVKAKSYVLNLKEDLTFESTGERTDLTFLAQTTHRVASDDALKEQIMALSGAGLSSRAISESFRQQGISIGKTKICEIISENSASSIVLPITTNVNQLRLVPPSLN